MSDDFIKYVSMKESGSTVDDVYRTAVNDQVDLITRIRLIRSVFLLSHSAAKEVVVRAGGDSQSLDEHQGKIAKELVKYGSVDKPA